MKMQKKSQKSKEELELEEERLAAEKKKKKPVRYPTEDLDVRVTEKDIKAGMSLKKPPPNVAMPFNQPNFELFLMSWNFLVVYGYVVSFNSDPVIHKFHRQPLHLSSFTLDEFEFAMRHSSADQPCALLAEVHSNLIYNLRTVTFMRHSATVSLLRQKEELEDDGRESKPVFGVKLDDLLAAMADVGNNWERVPLRHGEGREGWEDALVGCLKDVRVIVIPPFSLGSLRQFVACQCLQFPKSSGNFDEIALRSKGD